MKISRGIQFTPYFYTYFLTQLSVTCLFASIFLKRVLIYTLFARFRKWVRSTGRRACVSALLKLNVTIQRQKRLDICLTECSLQFKISESIKFHQRDLHEIEVPLFGRVLTRKLNSFKLLRTAYRWTIRITADAHAVWIILSFLLRNSFINPQSSEPFAGQSDLLICGLWRFPTFRKH